MVRDLRAGRDAQAEAALALIAAAGADVILLMDVDWDHGGAGLSALRDRLRDLGAAYPHALALRPNSGTPSGHDLDGDGRAHGPRDALGYGWFTGDSGLALLSRYPLGEAKDHSATLWSDRSDAAGLLPEAAQDEIPLATTAQWRVPLRVGEAQLMLVTLAAGTPVFDGPEDRNGLRNRDELLQVTDLATDVPLPVVLGRANQDPARGEGHAEALRALLDHPALQDVAPSDGGNTATVRWERAGEMRVDYVLPARGLRVIDSGILRDDAAGPARLVWVDVALP
ncbi:endonuclease/exonuclease/phosphatase family protein [Jannaschia marina]|uniref:endonuclease/exonuclease/phosphatase family protein n=1 Tax=Jannaschia marina TaxID=2741674 RepID=UPI0015CBF66E|nr:endonuclease/exonuclease/phosphatase family protein [Jannaschia marina]